MRNILLDTNAFSQYVKFDKEIIEVISQSNSVCLSIISIGELTYGFLKGEMNELNNMILNRFLSNPLTKLIDINRNIAVRYGTIYFYLKKRGTPIPTNDIWIAASAIETNSILVTYDKHFLKIPGVKLWDGLKKN